MVNPKRGEIYWVSLDPTVGTEIRKKRPAVVVSNDAANKRYNQVSIVPLTSQGLKQVEPFQVHIAKEDSGLSKDSKALAEQIRTVSKLRLGGRAGRLGEETQEALNTALKLHLGLDY